MKKVNKVLTTGAVITTLGITGVGTHSAFADEVQNNPSEVQTLDAETPDATAEQPAPEETPDAGNTDNAEQPAPEETPDAGNTDNAEQPAPEETPDAGNTDNAEQ
ncbi:hypothetical protein HUZ99_12400, partial [Staphylococcus sp. SS87]|nr:hypothetical protein [Staphylococcus singaporensis]